MPVSLWLFVAKTASGVVWGEVVGLGFSPSAKGVARHNAGVAVVSPHVVRPEVAGLGLIPSTVVLGIA